MFDALMPTGLKSDDNSSGMDVMMLAPWVVAMRMPDLMYEAATPWFSMSGKRDSEGQAAVAEKTAAFMESYGVVQAEMVDAWNNVMASAMLGQMPDAFQFSRSVQDFADASMEPMAKRVRANYQRLRSERD